MNKKILFPILALILVAVLYFSLSGKEASEQIAPITKTHKTELPVQNLEPLLKALPSEAFAFQIWNFTSPATEKAGKGIMVEGISPTIDAFLKADLIPTDPTKHSALANLIVYASGDVAKNFEIGALANNKQGEDLRNKLQTVLSELNKGGVQTKDENFEGLKGFSFEVKEEKDNNADAPEATAKNDDKKYLYLAASEDRLYANSSKEALASLIKRSLENPTNKIPNYDAELKRARALLPQEGGEIGFGLLDLKSVLNQAEKYVPSDKVKAEDLDKFIKNPPFTSIAMQRAFNDVLKDRVVLLPPLENTEKSLSSFISASNGNISADKVPASTAAFFSIDGALLNKLLDAALENSPEDKKAMLQPAKEILSLFKSLSVGVKSNIGGSPFPDLTFIIDVTDSAQFITKIKEMANDIAGQSGFGGMQWQDKSVENTNVAYMLSPLGVGAFLADLKGSVVIGTSEGAIRDAVLTQNNSASSLTSILNEEMKSKIAEKKLPLMYVLNLKAVAELLESTLASFSMFTGGHPPIEQSQLEMLKKSGTILGSVGTRDGAVEVTQEYRS